MQVLAGSRVELLIVDALQAHDGGHTQDVVRTAAARQVGGRPVQPQQYLAVGVGPGHMLDELAGDISRVEVGEDEDVGFSGHLAVGQLAQGDLRDERGINLQLAVEVGFEAHVMGLLLGQSRGGLDLHQARLGGAALGGVAQQGHAGADPRDLPG